MHSEILLDAGTLDASLDRLSDRIAEFAALAPVALVGIRTGGDHLARRLQPRVAARTGTDVPLGVADITLYRDDGFSPADWPTVGPTELPFKPSDHVVVLVDDVLFTGRTVRAALDVILDYGRPKAVRLAVLVDRGHREIPVAADAVGVTVDSQPGDHVDVLLTESGAPRDAVHHVRRPSSEESA